MNKLSIKERQILLLILVKISIEEDITKFQKNLLYDDSKKLEDDNIQFHHLELSKPDFIHLYDKWVIWANEKK